MKSEKAREFIKKTVDGYYNYDELQKDFITAVELAEAEMRERAIEAMQASCEFNSNGTCRPNISACSIDCNRVVKFIKALDNSKTDRQNIQTTFDIDSIPNKECTNCGFINTSEGLQWEDYTGYKKHITAFCKKCGHPIWISFPPKTE